MAICKEKVETRIWSEQQMLADLAMGDSAPFSYQRYLCVPNVSWGFLNYEADLLVVTESGYLKEVEIKISVSDLKRDLKKKKHDSWENPLNPVCELIYAMPEFIWNAVKETPPIPFYAGVIIIDESGRHSYVKRPERNKFSRPLFIEEKAKLSRLAHMRYWSLVSKNMRNN
jgi:hypothetical protein